MPNTEKGKRIKKELVRKRRELDTSRWTEVEINLIHSVCFIYELAVLCNIYSSFRFVFSFGEDRKQAN
jgi:hypothetical protein